MLILLIFAINTSCSPLSPQNGNSDDQLLWSIPITNGQLCEGTFPKLLHNNILVTHVGFQSQFSITGFDAKSGKEVWRWNDFGTDTYGIYYKFHFISNNNLVFRHGRRLYAIDTRSGKTNWRTFINGQLNGSEIQGIGNYLFTSAVGIKVFRTNLQQGQTEELVSVRPDVPIGNFALYSPTPFVSKNSDTLVVVPYSIIKTNVNSRIDSTYYQLFNISKRKTEYTKLIYSSNQFSWGFDNACIAEKDRLYFSLSGTVYCFDSETNQELWKEQFPAPFFSSGIIYYDGMIIGNCEDTFMYALDAQTGKQLWATKTSGTSSRLFEMNGVIYFTGGGDGLLHAVDAKTGRHIWKKESPDLQKNGGAWFFDSVTGADGKIYVSSYISLFCYKAAR
ncbi:MAG: PQQ-binding-like beta-propeller repeat protein [Candidatus Kapabacteria bacterium]|nr:PQQ-binding-like beta-propeller repeat protein [Candidatus Kapabacteria bacterium]